MSSNIYGRNAKYTHRKRRGPGGPVFGAIDLGTNNCRLLLAEPLEQGFRVIDGYSRIVRLGEGVSRTGRLNEEAMRRTIEALDICAGKARRLNAKKVHCIATEACRQAANGDGFLKWVTERTGLEFEIITPDREAQLTLSGCAPLLKSGHKKALVFDIGGGSTEVMWIDLPRGEPPRTLGMLSFPLGVVSLAEEYGRAPHSPEQHVEIRDRVHEIIDPFCAEHGIHNALMNDDVQMLGTSGTVTTLGAIHLGLNRYDRSRVDGLTIPIENIRAISARLAGMNMSERREIPCVGPQRADLMLMGCSILSAICEQWPVKALRAADRGIREGLLMGLIDGELRPEAPIEAAAPAVARAN